MQYNTIAGNTATGPAPTASVCAYQASQVSYNNLFANNAAYELRNLGAAGTTPIDATTNWWGTATESEIQAKIYDWFDDPSKGVINYNPWSTAIRTDAQSLHP